jgi:hypothetical protein
LVAFPLEMIVFGYRQVRDIRRPIADLASSRPHTDRGADTGGRPEGAAFEGIGSRLS